MHLRNMLISASATPINNGRLCHLIVFDDKEFANVFSPSFVTGVGVKRMRT